MAEEESPLITALPPASDPFTYLTIVEYNLSVQTLPLLHKVLQDAALTTNIGWDLVHLLVPYLPDSGECLHDVARLGNPREVILKVTESLRLIEYEDDDEDSDVHHDTHGGAEDVLSAESSTYPLKTAPMETDILRAGSTQAVELPPPLPLSVSQFVALLSMLAILHTRIKSKQPSRFLSTSLQAILASFSNSVSHRGEMIQAIVRTVKAISGTKRPALPNRQSSSMLSTSRQLQTDAPAGDPEALNDSQSTPDEKALQVKLLQSFITHVAEEYLLNLSSGTDDVPGLAWCSRMMEKLHPERTVPETKQFARRFADEEDLHRRLDAVGQLVNLAQDLKLTDEELLHAATSIEHVPAKGGGDEDAPPDSSEEISLSRLGSLLLYTARQVSSTLYDRPETKSSVPFAIFPDHHEILENCLAAPNHGAGSLGTEPEALIDAVLALAIVALEHDAIGEPKSDTQFNEYLQITALLSSNCPSPNLRGHAHYVASTILRSQPDENVRLSFIRDTLEDCPFENLKVSAVGWIKGETIEANPFTAQAPSTEATSNSQRSIFASPFALDSLAPHLFPSLRTDLLSAPPKQAWLTFQTNLSFYLASLNFLYFLFCAKHIHSPLDIFDLWKDNDIAASFLQPLREAQERFKKEMSGVGSLVEEKTDETEAELKLLDETLQRVTNAARLLDG